MPAAIAHQVLSARKPADRQIQADFEELSWKKPRLKSD
jgi:hypothetical protein